MVWRYPLVTYVTLSRIFNTTFSNVGSLLIFKNCGRLEVHAKGLDRNNFPYCPVEETHKISGTKWHYRICFSDHLAASHLRTVRLQVIDYGPNGRIRTMD